jgi:dolichol-phosphate mannosyltransferase
LNAATPVPPPLRPVQDALGRVPAPIPLALPQHAIAVVIPCYNVGRPVLDVVARIGPECARIYVIDDACPLQTATTVEAECRDPRVCVIRLRENQGVGGAVIAGYRQAMADGATLIVKIDGDGQMPPELLPRFVAPILEGTADYAKGNRFYDLTQIHSMPAERIVGNAVLSLLTKLSGGYWDVFDPTNGYTAVHAGVLRLLPLDKVSPRFFFETDMLFRLNTVRAVVVDVPMDAVYGSETSNLRIRSALPEFLVKHARNFAKRIFYNYFLRDVSVASLELVAGAVLLLFGVAYGGYHWWHSSLSNTPTAAGTVVLSAVALLGGLQLLLSFLNYDIANVPRRPIHKSLLPQAGARGAPPADRS